VKSSPQNGFPFRDIETQIEMMIMNTNVLASTPVVVDFEKVDGVACPCGVARRAFSEIDGSPLTVHVTEISSDAKTHYHRKLTETYYILECDTDAEMELNGERIPLKPGMCILIPPGVRHRAIGVMKIINIVTPKFDPADEHFD